MASYPTKEMAKKLKTASQLTALVNAELSKHHVCDHTGAEGIEPVADDRIPHNWTCKFLRGSSPHHRNVSRCLLQWSMIYKKSMILRPKNEMKSACVPAYACRERAPVGRFPISGNHLIIHWSLAST
jgi:hypothetical protein